MLQTIEDLERDYRELAVEHGTAIEQGKPRVANRAHDKLVATVSKIRDHGIEGEVALLRLMDDRSDSVAVWAATHSLRFAEEPALRVLDVVGQKRGLTSFSARVTADLWRRGELTPP